MEIITRPPFDENGYPEGYTEKKKKKKHVLPVILLVGLAAVLAVILFIRLRVTPAERGAEAILTAYSEVFGKESLLLRETGLSETLSDIREDTYRTDFSFAFKSTDYELPGNISRLLGGFDLNYLSGAGVKLSAEYGNSADLYAFSASYGGVAVKLLTVYSTEDELVFASPNFLKSTFSCRKGGSEKVTEWKILGLLPEKARALVTEGLLAYEKEKDRIGERVSRARELTAHFLSMDREKLLGLLQAFSYTKTGKTAEHMTVHGEKQAVTGYLVTADSSTFGAFLSYLFDWEESLITVTGADGNDEIRVQLYLTDRDELAGLTGEFTVNAAGIRLPVTVSAVLSGEEKAGDKAELTVTVGRTDEFSEEVKEALLLTVSELFGAFDSELPEELSELLSEYGELTVGELLVKLTILEPEELSTLLSENDGDGLLTVTLTKDTGRDGDMIEGEWSISADTPDFSAGTLTLEYSLKDNGKLSTALQLTRNGQTYFRLTGEGKLSEDTEEGSCGLSFNRLALTSGWEFVFKCSLETEKTDGGPEKPEGTSERELDRVTDTDLSEIQAELKEGLTLVESFLELVGID